MATELLIANIFVAARVNMIYQKDIKLVKCFPPPSFSKKVLQMKTLKNVELPVTLSTLFENPYPRWRKSPHMASSSRASDQQSEAVERA